MTAVEDGGICNKRFWFWGQDSCANQGKDKTVASHMWKKKTKAEV